MITLTQTNNSVPTEFLSAEKIKQFLPRHQSDQLKLIEVFDEIDSTNTYLLQKIQDQSQIPRVCIAESQTEGRGRRGRQWHSPFAQNIYFSLLWKFNRSTSDFQGLSLVIATAIAAVLDQLNLPSPVQLKWPNDVFVAGKKLAGILIETRGPMHDGASLVIGVGLNVNMQKASSEEVSQEWHSLSQLLHHSVDRNQLAANLIDKMIDYLQEFERSGFPPFKLLWEKYDMTFGNKIQVDQGAQKIQGKACGIDEQGRLKMLLPDGQNIVINIGDVSCVKD